MTGLMKVSSQDMLHKLVDCYNKRLHKLVDCVDIEIDEGIPVKDIEISNVEPNTKDIVKVKEERVQESKKED